MDTNKELVQELRPDFPREVDNVARETTPIESYTEHSATGKTADVRDTSKINPQGKPVVGQFPQNPDEEARVKNLDQ